MASIPHGFGNDKAYATEYALALALLPPDNDDKEEAVRAFSDDVLNRQLMLNIEYRTTGLPSATLHDPSNNNLDMGKTLIKDGLLLLEARRERKLKELVEEYQVAESEAKKAHNGFWQYGDITEDETNDR